MSLFSFFSAKKNNVETSVTETDLKRRQGILRSMSSGLKKTSSRINGGINELFSRSSIDQETLDDFEALLLSADIGVKTTDTVITSLKKRRFDNENPQIAVKKYISNVFESILSPCQKTLSVEENCPNIWVFCGVNGAGKTTTIGKIAHQLKEQKKKVMMVACDTFRAAAVEQLQIWAERSQAEFYQGDPGSDPASVAYSAVQKAQEIGIDVVLIDTAGRLQNKQDLMQQLSKMHRVLQKIDSHYPHQHILVLDATTGSNALSQMKLFNEAAPITGLIVTKLDGTAKGGMLVSLSEQYKKPLMGLGFGESIADLKPFDAKLYADTLVGLEEG